MSTSNSVYWIGNGYPIVQCEFCWRAGAEAAVGEGVSERDGGRWQGKHNDVQLLEALTIGNPHNALLRKLRLRRKYGVTAEGVSNPVATLHSWHVLPVFRVSSLSTFSLLLNVEHCSLHALGAFTTLTNVGRGCYSYSHLGNLHINHGHNVQLRPSFHSTQ